MTIKQMPLDDRPREKIWEKGVTALSNAELIAVLLRTGNKEKSALEIARELVKTPEQFSNLAIIQPAQLAMQKGIGPVKAATIVAALELGRRLTYARPKKQQVINTTSDAVDFLLPQLRHEDREYFLLLLLNAKGYVLHTERVFKGTLTSSVVHPREVFQLAVVHRAAALIVAHNHPSGDPEPSVNDIQFTKTLFEAGDIMGIPVLDHIIIGDGKYYSFQEKDIDKIN